MKRRVLITQEYLRREIDSFRSLFEEKGIDVDLPKVAQQLSEEELSAMIARYDGAIVGDDPFTRNVLEKAERLKILVKWGIGVDAIDLKAAEELGNAINDHLFYPQWHLSELSTAHPLNHGAGIPTS